MLIKLRRPMSFGCGRLLASSNQLAAATAEANKNAKLRCLDKTCGRAAQVNQASSRASAPGVWRTLASSQKDRDRPSQSETRCKDLVRLFFHGRPASQLAGKRRTRKLARREPARWMATSLSGGDWRRRPKRWQEKLDSAC